jgi:hypothetical protein
VSSASREKPARESGKEALVVKLTKKINGGGKNQTPKKADFAHLELSLEQHQTSPSLTNVSVSLFLTSLSYIMKSVLRLLFLVVASHAEICSAWVRLSGI